MGALPASLKREHTYYGDLFAARRVLEKFRSEVESKPSEVDLRVAVWKWKVEMKELVPATAIELESLLRSKWLFDCILPGGKPRWKDVASRRKYVLVG